ncbi:TonB-dependent receptor [Pontibacter sp. JH31]|uniref:TonB-dependent receptor n=1 Tax=Pontibacter aquaedesilientis TaxID=2766980 RepID=A0ABR7XFQ2_9BACT|nr:TonB-dependent receptor [Pontibacter aquaedesilientis]
MYKKFLLTCLCLILSQLVWAQRHYGGSGLKGRVTNTSGQALAGASIVIEHLRAGTNSQEDGTFEMQHLPHGTHEVRVLLLGYESAVQQVELRRGETATLVFQLTPKANQVAEVEVFGVRDKQPEKLEVITRLPLKPSEQIQSISVISDRLIQEQGALTITDVTRNVPGVYNFATYGNRRESMSSRGFRGIPVVKNGVRINSDFRGTGVLTDMEGVESIQVMKGASSITQGMAGDIGGPGGIINIVTKTPKFERGGYAALRVGSFGQVRPSFDVYGPLNESKTVAFRVNGALERAESYRAHVSFEKFYLNPSLEWRPDGKTTLTLEMDYLNDSRTPDLGTITLSDEQYNIFDLPHEQFLGFETDRTTTKNATFAARFNRKLNDNFSVRAAYFRSNLEVPEVATSLSQGKRDADGNFMLPAHQRLRSITQSNRSDKNSVVQFDLIGQDVQTGFLKHTFQVGTDFRTVNLELPTYASTFIDTIDVFHPIPNTLPVTPASKITATTTSNEASLGFMLQDVLTITDWAKAIGGVRYSTTESRSSATAVVTRGQAINPMAGLIVSPFRGLNLFASYTNSTNPRTATRLDKDGNELGTERIDQVEAGIKSDWLDNRLRFNLTLYQINNRNMNLQAVEPDANGVLIQMPYYTKGGNDERKGIEVELTGRVLDNLELIAGYALIDARYKEHTTFVRNSSPLNTPDQTANFWANYTFRYGALKGLALGGGAYYVGSRPNNDWTNAGVDYHEIAPGQEPWYMKAYTTVNLQASYQATEHLGVRLLFNNLLDEVGYNAYRVSFINPIDPRNMSAVLTYRFR